jgi:hypothetical protein
MAIKIFRRYMSILSVYKTGINNTVNEFSYCMTSRLFWKTHQVRKQSLVQHASENVSICHHLFWVDEDRHGWTYYWTHYLVFRYFLALFGDFIRELYIVRRTVVMFLDRAVIRRPLHKETKFVLFVISCAALLFNMVATDRFVSRDQRPLVSRLWKHNRFLICWQETPDLAEVVHMNG